MSMKPSTKTVNFIVQLSVIQTLGCNQYGHLVNKDSFLENNLLYFNLKLRKATYLVYELLYEYCKLLTPMSVVQALEPGQYCRIENMYYIIKSFSSTSLYYQGLNA